MLETCCESTVPPAADRQTLTYKHTPVPLDNMGQILSWIRGPRETPTLQDVAVEQQSQPKQATPRPAAQVSTGTASQFEKASSGSTMASKPGGVTTLKGGISGSTSIGTAGQGVPNVKPQTAPVSTVKSSFAASGTAATTASAANAAISTSKGSPNNTAKVQVEVPRTVETIRVKEGPEVDPFDALASILPPVDPVTPREPIFTGPEVKEHDATSEEAPKCGEREDTLPPEYRFENMAKLPTDVKPKDVPKPLSTEEALDSLSAGFMTSTVPTAPKLQEKDHAAASSVAPCCIAPPLKQKTDTPAPKPCVAVCPPADKKAKMEVDNFTLSAGISATPFKKITPVAPPTAVKELQVAKDSFSDLSLNAAFDTKSKADEGGVMSPGALSALGDMLAAPEPTPEPILNPKDIVSEDKHKEEDAVRVGERDDSIAPDYRFNKEELKKLPAPKPQPTLNTSEALDILSEDMLSSSAAPTQKADVSAFVPTVSVCSPPLNSSLGGSLPLDALSALSDTLPEDEPKLELPKLRPEDIVSEKKHKEEDAVLVGERDDSIAPEYRFNEEELKKLPAPKPQPTMNTNEALDLLSGDFMNFSDAPAQPAEVLLTSTKSAGVHAPLPPSTIKKPQVSDCPPLLAPQGNVKTDERDYMSLDALGALSDTLAAPEPLPEPPKLRPEDIVSEDKHKEEDAVLVGEREDSIPQEYRFNLDELKNLPAPKPDPKINTTEALDILSGDFLTSSAAPVVSSSAAPAPAYADFCLDALAAEFVPSSAAPTVKSAASTFTETSSELSSGASSALDALSESLITEITPAPQPAPISAKDLVKEKKAVEERLIKMGERDDSLPPEYRPTEEDLKKMAEAKAQANATPKASMDEKAALDLLSNDFLTTGLSSATATTELTPPVPESQTLKPLPGPVVEKLAETLLPDDPAFKAKTSTAKSKRKSKSKKHHASEPPAESQLSGQPSSDVVPTSTRHGKKS
ncbi:calpastatin [Stigmatopora nigra]